MSVSREDLIGKRIFVSSIEQSYRVQERLFDIGFSWRSSGQTLIGYKNLHFFMSKNRILSINKILTDENQAKYKKIYESDLWSSEGKPVQELEPGKTYKYVGPHTRSIIEFFYYGKVGLDRIRVRTRDCKQTVFVNKDKYPTYHCREIPDAEEEMTIASAIDMICSGIKNRREEAEEYILNNLPNGGDEEMARLILKEDNCKNVGCARCPLVFDRCPFNPFMETSIPVRKAAERWMKDNAKPELAWDFFKAGDVYSFSPDLSEQVDSSVFGLIPRNELLFLKTIESNYNMINLVENLTLEFTIFGKGKPESLPKIEVTKGAIKHFKKVGIVRSTPKEKSSKQKETENLREFFVKGGVYKDLIGRYIMVKEVNCYDLSINPFCEMVILNLAEGSIDAVETISVKDTKGYKKVGESCESCGDPGNYCYSCMGKGYILYDEEDMESPEENKRGFSDQSTKDLTDSIAYSLKPYYDTGVDRSMERDWGFMSKYYGFFGPLPGSCAIKGERIPLQGYVPPKPQDKFYYDLSNSIGTVASLCEFLKKKEKSYGSLESEKELEENIYDIVD